MAKKGMAKAYIENGRIKIVDSYGSEYEKEINDNWEKSKELKI